MLDIRIFSLIQVAYSVFIILSVGFLYFTLTCEISHIFNAFTTVRAPVPAWVAVNWNSWQI